MARIQAKSEFCISCQSPLYQLPESSVSAARVQRNPFIYARKLKIDTDLLGQKRDVKEFRVALFLCKRVIADAPNLRPAIRMVFVCSLSLQHPNSCLENIYSFFICPSSTQ